MRALKMRSAVVGHQKLITINWEQSSKLNFLQLYKKLLKNSASTILWSFGIRSKLERWKSSISWCLMNWPEKKKTKHIILKGHLLLYCATATNHFCQIVTCDKKWILYDSQLSGWTEKKLQSTSQSQACTRKRSRSLFGGLLPVWSTAAFWISGTPLHLRSMLSKLIRCTRNCNACSWHWSTKRSQFFSTRMPNCTSHNQCLRSWTNWDTKFCLIRHIHLTSHQPPLLQASQHIFAGKTLRQPAGGRKCFPGVHRIPNHGFLCHRNKQTYFLLAKICWL